MMPHFTDSLVASEFEVFVGQDAVKGVFRVTDFVSFQLDAHGSRLKPSFSIAKMVQHDATNAFNSWLRETTDARHSETRPTREIVLKAVDDGTVTRTWTIKGAYIVAVRYSDFNVASFDMVAETVTIAYEDIEEAFHI